MNNSLSQTEQSVDIAAPFQIQQGMSCSTMSSREIADLTGKRHPDVKRDIQAMAKDLMEDVSNFARIYLDGMNRQQTEYFLDREHTDCLLTGYSAAMRMAVIHRWHQLEGGAVRVIATLPDFSDPVAAARAWADQVEQKRVVEQVRQQLTKVNHELEVKVEQDAPKVAFHDMVTVSHKTYNAAQAAKIIGTGRTRLLQFMRQKGWVTRSNEPYQAKIEAGLLDVKLGTFEHPLDGTVPTCSTLITGKGLTKLQAMWQSREEELLK
ncbi:phage antirepressor KilAC domain-containing protein [Pseudomonas sp. S2_B10]